MDTELNIVFNENTITNPFIKNAVSYQEIDKLESIYTKIYIGDLLNYIPVNEVLVYLTKIRTKLVPVGQIVIEEYDQHEVCLAVINESINSPDFNNIIRLKQQILSMLDTIDILTKSGYRIYQKDVDALKHSIVATV